MAFNYITPGMAARSSGRSIRRCAHSLYVRIGPLRPAAATVELDAPFVFYPGAKPKDFDFVVDGDGLCDFQKLRPQSSGPSFFRAYQVIDVEMVTPHIIRQKAIPHECLDFPLFLDGNQFITVGGMVKMDRNEVLCREVRP